MRTEMNQLVYKFASIGISVPNLLESVHELFAPKNSPFHFEVVGSKLSGLKRRRPMSTAFTGSFTEETLVANSCSMSSSSSYRGPLRPLGTLLSHVNIPHGWPFHVVSVFHWQHWNEPNHEMKDRQCLPKSVVVCIYLSPYSHNL